RRAGLDPAAGPDGGAAGALAIWQRARKGSGRRALSRSLRGPATVHVPGGAAHLSAGIAAEKQRQFAQLFGGNEFQRRLLLGQQVMGARCTSPSARARSSICCCTSGVSTQPGQSALQVMSVVAVSSATTLVRPTTP